MHLYLKRSALFNEAVKEASNFFQTNKQHTLSLSELLSPRARRA